MLTGSKPLLGPMITKFYDAELYDGELIIRDPGKINWKWNEILGHDAYTTLLYWHPGPGSSKGDGTLIITDISLGSWASHTYYKTLKICDHSKSHSDMTICVGGKIKLYE